MKKLTIAVDWLTGTWKWTTAKRVATRLSYLYLDTWAMYRAVTLYAIRHDLLDASAQDRAGIIDTIDLDFTYNKETDHYDILLDGENVERAIRKTDLAMQMQPIVTCMPLRKKLVQLQQERWKKWWIVADWRDIGTTVFPDAQVKVFLVCPIDIRVERRAKQLAEQNHTVDIDKIRREIIQRDQTDYLWPDAVNTKADDAVVIDTGKYTIQQQIDRVVELVDAV